MAHAALRRRVDVETHLVAQLAGEGGVLGQLESLCPVWLRLVLSPDPLHPGGRAWRPERPRRRCCMHQQATQIAVAVAGHPEQPGLAAAAVLARDQTQPSGKAAAVVEPGSTTAHRRHQGSGQHRFDAGNGHQPSAGIVPPRQRQDLLFQRGDRLVDRTPLRRQTLDQPAQHHAECIRMVLEQAGRRLLQGAPAKRHGDAALEQKAADLVNQRRAHADQPVARPVQRLHVEPGRCLDRHKE